jgi:hypothetical protein
MSSAPGRVLVSAISPPFAPHAPTRGRTPRAHGLACFLRCRVEGFAGAVVGEQEALARALAYTEGYPYFLQEYGRRAWAQGDGPRITAEDAETARALVEEDLDENFFEGRIGRLTDSEKLYVAAMADLGDGPQSSAAVARRLGRTPKSVSPQREALIGNGVVYAPGHGLIDFTVPRCGAFIRRRYPLPARR